MIDDLFTDLTFAELERLLSNTTSAHAADLALARLNERLLPEGPQTEGPAEALEHLLQTYLRLRTDSLEVISPRVHEWALDRLTEWRRPAGAQQQLTVLYFLFGDGSVRHATVGALLHSQSERDERSPVSEVGRIIADDKDLHPDERSYMLRSLADSVLDHLDALPRQSLRAIRDLHRQSPEIISPDYVMGWAERLGGEYASMLREALFGDR